MSSEEERGVYFKREDYAGLGRRLLIDVVDFSIVGMGSLVVFVRTVAFGLESQVAGGVLLTGLAGLWVGYFVILKGSRWGTPGYRLADARIVNLRGERAGYGALFMRLIFMAVGPLNAFIDLFWLTGDADRQTLRDKFASTYVVRRAAQADGNGAIRFRTYTFWGMTFLFREVQRSRRAA